MPPVGEQAAGRQASAREALAVPNSINNGHVVNRDALRDALARERETLEHEHTETTLPAIRVNNRALRDISHDAIEALAHSNKIFVRGGQLVRVRLDEKQHASIETINESALRGMLARAADFYAQRKTKDGARVDVTVHPPLDVVRDILMLGDWPFPAIEGVVESPIIRADGSILDVPGYDERTRLIYNPSPGFDMPRVPDEPGHAHVDAALALLNEVIVDFPFEDEASHDNALAAILTIVAREMIDGPVPVCLVDSPQQESGKTLLASVIASLATGEAPDLSASPNDAEEWQKTIAARLATGRLVAILDNLTSTLEDSTLAGVITARVWSGRVLGRNDKEFRLPVRTVWFVTGNNIRVGGDMSSRCYLVRIDAKMSRPSERTHFKHPDLEKWVQKNRGSLLASALTLCRAWHVAGRPKPTQCTMRTRFHAWQQTVGGILEFAGVRNFLGNMRRFYEIADSDTPAWEAFITKLHELWPSESVTCGQVYARFAASDELAEWLPEPLRGMLGDPDDDRTRGKFAQRLGYEFKTRRSKRHGESHARIELDKPSDNKSGSRWRFMLGQ